MLRSSWNLSAVGGYTDTIGRSATLSIAYHNVTYINAMPARDSNNKNQDCSYREIEYRLCPGSRGKAKNLSGLAGACRFV